MAKKRTGNLIGSWAFLIGVAIAVIFGFFNVLLPWVLVTLAIIGLIIGFLNIADEETEPFLFSGIALIIASALGGQAVIDIPVLGNMLYALLVIFVPATIVVAIKNVFSLARR